MNRRFMLLLLSSAVLTLAACHAHPNLQYKPPGYAKLRNIDLLLVPPNREYELVAYVEGSGGRFTAPETMINAMIDEARKSGAQALIPLEFAEGPNAPKGIDQFLVTENQRTLAKGRAIRWKDVHRAYDVGP